MADDAFDLSPSGGLGEVAVAVAIVLARFADTERAVLRHDGAGEVELSLLRARPARAMWRRVRTIRGHSVVVEVTDPGGVRHRAAIQSRAPGSASVTWLSPRFADAGLGGRTRRVLDALRRRPQLPIRDLPALTAEEHRRHERLRRRSTPGVDVDAALRRHGGARPAAPAVIDSDRVVTYAELDAAVTAFARGLAMHVDGAKAVVALRLPRSFRLVVAVLGALRAGVAFTSTGPRTPPERSRSLIEDAGAAILVSDAPIDDLAVPCTTVEQLLIGGGTDPPQAPAVPTDPAYVLYTSGSTGRPKGVVVSRDALECYLGAVIPAYELGPDDRVLQVAEPGFDVLIEEILPTIAAGGTVVVAGVSCLQSPTDFDAFVTAAAVTVLNLPSSLWTTLYRRDGGRQLVQPPACVRLVIVGSERVPVSAYLAWQRAASPRPRLINAYGTTETTITSITCDLDERVAEVVERLGVVPIGLPLANSDVRVRDSHGDPPPFGVPGELVIGGRSVFSRYIGAPSRPASDYRTGDLVCLDRSGLLAHLGRMDGQVKVRGHRVEPAEIESALETLTGVARAACTTIGSDDDARLVASVVPVPGAVLDGLALRHELSRRLPDWLVPSEISVASSLPLNEHGTVDRRALQTPTHVPAETGLTPTEHAVSERVAQILGRAAPAAWENFFTLGGTSLQAIRLVARLADDFGVAMGARQVFLTPTIKEIAAWLDAALPTGCDPIGRRSERGLFPLTPGQRAMLRFLGSANRPRPYFEMWEGFRLTGPLDPAALRWALLAVVEENEALRTVVAATGPAQRVLTDRPPLACLVDLSHLSGHVQSEAVERELIRARRPFDLTAEPAFRPVILRLGAEEHVLSLTMHHLFFDGWSFGLLNDRLTELYSRYPQPTVPSLRPEFGDYAIWLERRATDEVRAADLAYWARELGGYRPVDLAATDLSVEHASSVADRTLDAATTAAMEALATSCMATPFAVLAAVFVTVLGRLLDRADLLFASNDANRYHTSAEQMIGYLATTQLTRIRLTDAGSFRDLVHGLHATLSTGRQHMSLHWEDMLTELGLAGAAQFRFSLQDTPNAGSLVLPGLAVEPIPEPAATGGRRPIAVTVWRRAAGYEINWSARDDLVPRLSSRAAVAMFAAVAGRAVTEPEITVPALQRLVSP